MSKNSRQFSGEWSKPGRKVQVNVPLIVFEEDGQQIAFCPALDLLGYGNSEQEAIQTFSISLGEYLLYTTNKGILGTDLKAHGWTVKKSLKKPMIPQDMGFLLSSNEEFSRVFNTHEYRKLNHSIELPACA